MKADVKVCGKSIGEYEVGDDTFRWLKDNIEFEVQANTKPAQNLKDLVAGLPEIMEDFIKDNRVLVEKYQSGIKSLLDTLAERAADKVGATDIEKVKTALEDFLRPKRTPPTEEQKHKVLHILWDTFGSEKLNNIFARYISGDMEVLTKTATIIRKVYSVLDKEALVEIVKEYLEEQRTKKNENT